MDSLNKYLLEDTEVVVKEEIQESLPKEEVGDVDLETQNAGLEFYRTQDYFAKEEYNIIDSVDDHKSFDDLEPNQLFQDPKLLLQSTVLLYDYRGTSCKKPRPKVSVEKLKVYAQDSQNIHLPLKCVFCEFIAQDIKCMIKHRRLHNPDRFFPCMKCKFSATNQNYLKIHLSITHSEKYFECAHCDYKSKYKSNLSIHLEKHTNDNLSCDVCGKKLSSSATLKKHLELVHSPITDKPHKCNLCGFESNYRSSLPRHMQDVHFKTTLKPLQCDTCGYKTVKKSMLDRHVMKHTRLKPYKCTQCNYSTTNSGSLNIHRRVIHDPDPPRPFTCAHCAKCFKTKGSLTIHMWCHVKTKTVPCPDCDFVANSLHRLRSHRVIHSKAMFHCSQCDYKNRFKHQLRKHVLCHNGPVLKCSHCGYTTPNIHTMFGHSAEKHVHFAHECSACGWKFKSYRQTNLRKHIASHHQS